MRAISLCSFICCDNFQGYHMHDNSYFLPPIADRCPMRFLPATQTQQKKPEEDTFLAVHESYLSFSPHGRGIAHLLVPSLINTVRSVLCARKSRLDQAQVGENTSNSVLCKLHAVSDSYVPPRVTSRRSHIPSCLGVAPPHTAAKEGGIRT